MDDMELITMNYTKVNEAIKDKIEDKVFKFNIKFLDEHINTILINTDASYSQVSFVALTICGFILSHGGAHDSSIMTLDFSDSGTGKSHNMSLQYNLLLKNITTEQDNLQLLSSDDEHVKRYINIHRGKITVPALYQCIKTTPAQLLMIDELGLLLQKDDDIIAEVTKLYGTNDTAVPLLKTEAPSSKSVVPVALSFIGATTLSYFGSSNKLKYHTSGGFVNRALIAYNKVLKTPEQILSIKPSGLNYSSSNKLAVELLSFTKKHHETLDYNTESEVILLNFKRKIQKIKILFQEQGNDDFGLFYNRTFQNTQLVINILHYIQCFESKNWTRIINTSTIEIAIEFIQRIVFTEIDKLISYLADDDLLQKEEKQKEKIIKFVDEYLAHNQSMPKIRDISIKTRLSKNEILELMKDYLELIPASTVFRFCQKSL